MAPGPAFNKELPFVKSFVIDATHAGTIRTGACALILFLTAGQVRSQPAEITTPPGASAAVSALEESPRHGEFVEIEVPGRDSPLVTWVVYPERSDKAPVIVVIHEIYGLTDWIRAIADHFAKEGFIAVAPDLLSGKGPDGGNTDSFSRGGVRMAIMGLNPDEVVSGLNAARDYALALPSAGPKASCVGFCWGGRTSFRYATAQPELSAAVVFYGTPPGDDSLGRLKTPVLGLYGGDDARVTSTVPGTVEKMSSLSKPYEAKIYDGAGHGFLRQQDTREGANRDAAVDAWARTIEFLRNSSK